jgi:hypothetical protein
MFLEHMKLKHTSGQELIEEIIKSSHNPSTDCKPNIPCAQRTPANRAMASRFQGATSSYPSDQDVPLQAVPHDQSTPIHQTINCDTNSNIKTDFPSTAKKRNRASPGQESPQYFGGESFYMNEIQGQSPNTSPVIAQVKRSPGLGSSYQGAGTMYNALNKSPTVYPVSSSSAFPQTYSSFPAGNESLPKILPLISKSSPNVFQNNEKSKGVLPQVSKSTPGLLKLPAKPGKFKTPLLDLNTSSWGESDLFDDGDAAFTTFATPNKTPAEKKRMFSPSAFKPGMKTTVIVSPPTFKKPGSVVSAALMNAKKEKSRESTQWISQVRVFNHKS